MAVITGIRQPVSRMLTRQTFQALDRTQDLLRHNERFTRRGLVVKDVWLSKRRADRLMGEDS